ncbi:MAG: hypothetical protein JW804_01865 [Sedimentisphaerales bacterium]|nr:hypothetical protein [Sedimentisphaerales bacterium]
MKRTALTVLITAISLIFISANGLGVDSNEIEFHIQMAEPEKHEQALKEATEPQDANDTGPYGGMSKEMRDAWEKVDQEGADEVEHWSKPGMDERLGLARAAQNTTKAELLLIRKIAQSENAKETVLAIDKMLAKRNKRFDDIMAKAEEEKTQKEQNQRNRPERTERKRLTPEERRRLMEERRNNLRSRRDTGDLPED